ncbi:hypothetical protein C8F04DRAFT_1274045 [Mycena alexandri]|uniref:Uncharacterized protein n=1 Tax=Mycena alexandri TaxID=1745969 RepID=A0AAD6S4S6_9AGAR|nr:hypothetical protein C8F04DRAFT_1274045 [Mycena alexandri]
MAAFVPVLRRSFLPPNPCMVLLSPLSRFYTTFRDASPFEGSLRLRLSSDNMPSSFGKGRDLLGPSGFPWQTNLLQIARVSRWHRVCEQLLKENLVTTAQLAWCRDPSLPATIPSLSLFRLSQEFPIICGGQNTFAFIGEGVHPTSPSICQGRRTVHLRITKVIEPHTEGPVVKPEDGQLLHLLLAGGKEARPWAFDIDDTSGDGAAGFRMLWDASKM